MGQPAAIFHSADPTYLAKIASLLERLNALVADARRDLDPSDYDQYVDRAKALLLRRTP